MKKIDPISIMQMDPSIFPQELLGRLKFKITQPTLPPLPAGQHYLGLDENRDTILIVPEGLKTDEPVPFFVMFHGSSGSAEKVLPFVEEYAHQHQFLLMLPQSTFYTWDLTIGGHGPDLDRLEKALSLVSSRFILDPAHFALAGFSDGASYALSTGLTNGELVSHIIVFSGGFMNVYVKTGKPRVFITHSPEDEQLNIKTSALKHVKELKNEGYDVIFELFSGRHTIHPPVVKKAMDFFLTKNNQET